MKSQKDKKTLGQREIVTEINLAEKECRPVNLSNSIIPDLSSIDRIKYGLNLENSEVLISVFLGEIIISGDLNMKGIEIKGSLYLGNSSIKEDLILENAIINGAVNLVGSKIKGSVNAKGIKTSGFLSLSKSEIGGDVILENAEIKNAEYDDLIVRGDLFIDTADIKGSLNLGKTKTEGVINLEKTQIGNNIILTGAESKKGEIDTNMIKIEGKKII
jgi:hypothetical protein